MNIYPNIRCTICKGQVYREDDALICLMCNRTVAHISTLRSKDGQPKEAIHPVAAVA